MKKNIQCVAFIMDGNRRWAKGKKLPTFEGHRRGYNKLFEVVDWIRLNNIKNLILYAFSTENWNRKEDEVHYLMDLFREMLVDLEKKAQKEEIQIRFIGQRERFENDIQKSMDILETNTSKYKILTVTVALSYGGQAEIVHAINQIINSGVKDVTEEIVEQNLWTKNLQHPDIIIRTGGERRLSNFLTWQSVYSELFFVDTYWPDFSKKEFEIIINDYFVRQRRFGK